MPWDSSFAEFPQGRDESAVVGPRDWSIAFVHIPARRLGPSELAAEALRLRRASAIQHPSLPEQRDYLVLPLLPATVRAAGLIA